jgi:hypothetical protein
MMADDMSRKFAYFRAFDQPEEQIEPADRHCKLTLIPTKREPIRNRVRLRRLAFKEDIPWTNSQHG